MTQIFNSMPRATSPSHGGLPTPGYRHNQQSVMYGYAGGSGGGHNGTLPSQMPTTSSAHQPPTPPTATSPTHADPYSLPPPNSNYYASSLHRPAGSNAHSDLSAPAYGQSQQQHSFSNIYGHSNSHPRTLPLHTVSSAHQPPTPPSATTSHAQPASRPPLAQSYFSAVSSPHHAHFNSYGGSSAASPTTPGGLSSINGMAPPTGFRTPYQPYGHPHGAVPSMSQNGTIMSNLHNPGGQLSVMPALGGHHPYVQHMHGMYGHPHPNTADRPFKCDQCPQSFNRNHDLKRHKRIHLSVKPFPCGSCDKAFSRKDALKRHRLVKGCGDRNQEDSHDTSVRSEASTSESPTITKTE